MKNRLLALSVLILLTLPACLLAQNQGAKAELPFDKAFFKEENYFMLELLSAQSDPSPLMTSYIFISPYSEYGIRGRSNTAGYDSLILKELAKEFDASSFEQKENKVLKPGDELLNYFLDNCNPNTIVSFRFIARGKVQVKRYALLFD